MRRNTKQLLPTVLFKDCYRIVNDNYRGYEVQVKRWFFPFSWFTKEKKCRTNTFSSIEQAKEWIEKGCPRDIKIKAGSVVYWKNLRQPLPSLAYSSLKENIIIIKTGIKKIGAKTSTRFIPKTFLYFFLLSVFFILEFISLFVQIQNIKYVIVGINIITILVSIRIFVKLISK